MSLILPLLIGPLHPALISTRDPSLISGLVSGAPTSDCSQLRARNLGNYLGTGRIAGTVQTNGAASVDRVLLYDQHTGERIGAQRSEGGVFNFPGIDTTRLYRVVGEDVEAEYNDVIFARVAPVVS